MWLLDYVNIYDFLPVFPKIQGILCITRSCNTKVPTLSTIQKQAGNSDGFSNLVLYMKEF